MCSSCEAVSNEQPIHIIHAGSDETCRAFSEYLVVYYPRACRCLTFPARGYGVRRVAARWVGEARLLAQPRRCPPTAQSRQHNLIHDSVRQTNLTADTVRPCAGRNIAPNTDCNRWPPLRSTSRSSRSVCCTHVLDSQISQTDATDADPKRFNRHQSDRFKCMIHRELGEQE